MLQILGRGGQINQPSGGPILPCSSVGMQAHCHLCRFCPVQNNMKPDLWLPLTTTAMRECLQLYELKSFVIVLFSCFGDTTSAVPVQPVLSHFHTRFFMNPTSCTGSPYTPNILFHFCTSAVISFEQSDRTYRNQLCYSKAVPAYCFYIHRSTVRLYLTHRTAKTFHLSCKLG